MDLVSMVPSFTFCLQSWGRTSWLEMPADLIIQNGLCTDSSAISALPCNPCMTVCADAYGSSMLMAIQIIATFVLSFSGF